jgi:hypothetical protein
MSCVFVSAKTSAGPRASSPQSGQKQDAVKPEAIQGCYDLTLSPWFPDLRLGEDEEFITPPARIQLFATKGIEGWESHGYIVRPAPGIKPSIHRGAYWLPKGSKAIEIVWTTGFSGLVMALKTSDAEVLRGKAQTFWDFSRKKQTADVVARRVDCEKK